MGLDNKELERILNQGTDEMNTEVHMATELTKEMHDRSTGIRRETRTLIDSYFRDLKRFHEGSVQRLREEIRSRKRGRENTLPTDRESITNSTGLVYPSVDVEIDYTPIKRNFFEWLKRSEKKATLKAKIIDSEHSDLEMPGLTLSEGGREDPEKVAEYLFYVVEKALRRDVELALNYPYKAELNTLFESGLICNVAHLLGNTQIIAEYQALRVIHRTGDDDGKLVGEFREEAQKAGGKLLEKLGAVDGEIVELDGRVKDFVNKLKTELEAYAAQRREGIEEIALRVDKELSDANAKIRGVLEKYEEAERVKIDRRLSKDYGAKQKELEKTVAELDSQIRAKTQQLKILDEGDLKKRQYFIDKLRPMFPNYDMKNGDEEDVTPVVRAEYAVRLSKIQSKLDNEKIADLIGIIRKKVRPSASGKKYKNSDIRGVIELVEWLAPQLDYRVTESRAYSYQPHQRVEKGSFVDVKKLIESQKPGTAAELRDYLKHFVG